MHLALRINELGQTPISQAKIAYAYAKSVHTIRFPFFIGREDNSWYQKAIEYGEDGVDIVVSHQPPYSILDLNPHYGHFGSPTLLKKVKTWQPKFHFFGHIHEAYGRLYEEGTTFINAAQIRYEVATPLRPPIVIDL